MGIEHVIAFNAALLAAFLSPGPAFLLAVSATLTSGRKAGLATGVGLATMATIWTMMALLGLEIVFELFPWAYATVKILGAGYLIVIAIQMWRGARNPVGTVKKPTRDAFVSGFLINLLNPKSVLFAAAVLVVILPSRMTIGESAIIVANHFVLEVSLYSILVYLMSTRRVRDRYLTAKVYLDRFAAVLLGAFGLRLLVSR